MPTRTVNASTANVSKKPKSLAYTLAELTNDLVALANELRTDHADFKTLADQTKTLVNAIKTVADDNKALVNTVKTVADENKTLVNDIRTKLNAWVANGMVSSASLAIGSNTARVASRQFLYTISGILYSKAAEATGTVPGNDVIPVNKFGAVALDIGDDGTIDAIEAPGNEAGTYDTAGAASGALPAAAANHVRMGFVTASKSDGDFTFGATALNAANTTVAYTSNAGVLAGLGAAVASSTGAAVSSSTGSAVSASSPAGVSSAAVDDISFRDLGTP